MSKKRKPEKMWAFWAARYGAFYETPRRVTFRDSLKRWYYRECEIRRPGLYCQQPRYITFADESKEKVQTFIDGFMACMQILRAFCAERRGVEGR